MMSGIRLLQGKQSMSPSDLIVLIIPVMNIIVLQEVK